MSTLFVIIIVVGVLALIGYPLFKGTREEEFAEVKRVTPSLAKDKEALLNTLGEIEFDYHMNKLSEEDYQSLKNNYAGAAIAISKAEENAEAKGKGKVKSAKTTHKSRAAEINVTDIEQEIEAELKSIESASDPVCHRCGIALKEAGQEYCHSCGERQF